MLPRLYKHRVKNPLLKAMMRAGGEGEQLYKLQKMSEQVPIVYLYLVVSYVLPVIDRLQIYV